MLPLPSDPVYRQAKRAKLGERRIPEALDRFVTAFDGHFGVRPLWLVLDAVETNGPGLFAHRPRLEVVVERQAALDRLTETLNARSDILEAFIPTRETGAALSGLLLGTVDPRYLRRAFKKGNAFEALDRLHVICSAFEPAAIEDAHRSISLRERRAFDRSVAADAPLWTVSRMFGPPVVLLRTDADARRARSTGLLERWGERYFEDLRRHDRFEYATRTSAMVRVESKETLDRDFEGNLFYFWK